MKRMSSKRPIRLISPMWKKDRCFVVCALFFAAGLTTGCIVSCGYVGERGGIISAIAEEYVLSKPSETIPQTFFSSFASLSPYILAVFLLGFCALGTPLVPAAAALRGIGLGAMLGHMYSVHGMKGMIFSLLIIIPPAIISLSALLLSCREAMHFSSRMFSCFLSNSSRPEKIPDMKRYCLKFIIFFFMIVAASLVDCLFTLLFSGLISF
ncbi:MAG: stage II sporulation protein M [Clostridia bacterium]|nr:stage II sporulation protein M [Clostridia bacterium]